jgi:signal transduction histidine kinase
LINKSVSLLELGLFAEGEQSLREALKISREKGHKKIEHNALFNLGSVYADQGLYRKAIAYYDSGLIVLKDINAPYSLLVNYQNLSPVYKALGDYKNAFHYQSLYFNLKDSLYKLEKMETVNDLELKYQKKENEAKILGLENENLRKDVSIRKKTAQRNMVTYTAFGVFIIAVFLFAYYRQRVRKNRIITQQKIKQLEEEKKLLAARSLVEGQEEERKRIAKDLHDGIGVLLSTARMQFTALKDKNPENNALVDKAGKLLEQASVDVRRISHNMMPGLLTKYGLNEAIADLFEQLDDTPGLSAKMDTNEETKRLAENQEIMLYRIVQELVNNTLKHARAKNISLILDYTGDKLGLRYADDGVGFDMGEKTETVSIGMKCIESRVSFLGGEVNIESAKGKGLHCHIEVPVEYRKVF